MKKLLQVAMQLSICIVLLLTFSSAISASEYNSITKEELKNRIESLSSQIDLRYTAEVHAIINTYIAKQRSGSEIILSRGQVYFPLYDSQFLIEGLPQELKYLSVVESGLRPDAVSKAGAAGLWQFIPSTGRLYGLTINSAVDERRDPVRSTQAASAYLRDLFAEFGEWTLALAAYNCGPGNVRKALRRSSGEAFWDIKGYLPRETRRYVPKYVAISYLMNFHSLHNLMPNIEAPITSRLATVRIHDYLDFSKIVELTGLSSSEVSDMNPAYLKRYIPKSSGGYFLTLPEQELFNVLGALSLEYEIVYTSNSDIAEKAHMMSDMKRRFNSLNDQIDLLPSTVMSTSSVASLSPAELPSPRSEDYFTPYVKAKALDTSKYTKLERNQSLTDLAEMHNITLSALVVLNDLDLTNPPVPGTYLRVEQ